MQRRDLLEGVGVFQRDPPLPQYGIGSAVVAGFSDGTGIEENHTIIFMKSLNMRMSEHRHIAFGEAIVKRRVAQDQRMAIQI